MMWTDVVQAVAAVGTLLATMFGFVYVARQIKLVRRGLNAQANAGLSEQSLSILSFIAEHPETYDYLYNNKRLIEGDANAVAVQCLCEMVANYCDLVVAMLPDLAPEVVERWKRFIIDTASCSPALRNHLNHHRLWYSDELLTLL